MKENNKIGGTDNGEPLVGASVVIRGSTIGTITDLEGKYSLAIPAGGGDLQIEYLGYIAQTQPINSSNINIRLEEDHKMLDEVVTIGYGTLSKEMLTGAVAGVKTSAPRPASKPVPVPVAQVENTTSVEFEIKTPYTIASENKVTVVEMEHYP